MDEIGYQVRSIEPDGRLLVDVLGGGYTEYFLGHVVLVHKADGTAVGGVLELPSKWDQPGFEWPRGAKAMDEAVHLYVGTHSAEETQKLGIKVGDWATIPKKYRPLIGSRANARSFDDRVGCAALIEAVKALGPDAGERQVTFIWSTEEEVGLKGAAAAAERMAKDGNVARFCFRHRYVRQLGFADRVQAFRGCGNRKGFCDSRSGQFEYCAARICGSRGETGARKTKSRCSTE